MTEIHWLQTRYSRFGVLNTFLHILKYFVESLTDKICRFLCKAFLSVLLYYEDINISPRWLLQCTINEINSITISRFEHCISVQMPFWKVNLSTWFAGHSWLKYVTHATKRLLSDWPAVSLEFVSPLYVFSLLLWLYSPFVGHRPFFRFLILYTTS
jgi:hypothetical protein